MSDTDVIYMYTLAQAVADCVLVEIFKRRWTQLSGGKPMVATAAVFQDISLAGLIEIWKKFVHWRKFVEPTLREEDRLFKTEMNSKTVWVLEDGQAFTILYPEDY